MAKTVDRPSAPRTDQRQAAGRLGFLVPARRALAEASLWRAVVSLGLANWVFILLGFVQVLVVGAVVGAGRGYDLFLLAWLLPELLLFALGNILQMHVVPALHRIGQGGGQTPYRQAVGAVLTGSLGLLAAVLALGYMAAPWLVGRLAPWLEAERLGQGIVLFRLLLLTFAVHAIVKLLGNLHRAAHSLKLTAVTQSMVPLAAILFLGLRPAWGVWGLWAGMTAGAALQAAALAPALHRWGLLRLRRCFSHPLIRDLGRNLAFLAVVGTGMRLVLAADRLVAAQLQPGSVAVLKYTLFFILMVQAAVTMPLLSVFFNRLSALAGKRQWFERWETVLRALEIYALLLVPIAGFLMLFAQPLTAWVFGRGVFDAHSLERTAEALRFHAPLVPLVAGYFTLLAVHTTRGRYAYPFWVGLALAAVNLLADLALAPACGLPGLAAASSVVLLAWVLLLAWPLRAGLDPPRLLGFLGGLGRCLAVTLAAAGMIAGWDSGWPDADHPAGWIGRMALYAAAATGLTLWWNHGLCKGCWAFLQQARVGR